MPDLKKDFNLTHEDGFTSLMIADSDFDTIAETRKGKDGETVATGITKRVFHYRVSQSSVDKGEGAITVKPDGSTAVTREVKIVIRDQNEEAIKAKREAARWSNFAKDFRRFCGLSKSAKAVDSGDKLTRQDVENFANGLRKVKGYFFHDLPQSAQEAVTKAYSDLLKKEQQAKPKQPTLAQLAELAALAAIEGKSLGQDWMQAYEAAKAKAAQLQKGKAAKAAKPVEVQLTEQGND